MFFRSLALSSLILVSNVFASGFEGGVISAEIFSSPSIESASQCLNEDFYNFAISYQGFIHPCSTPKQLLQSVTESELASIEQCVVKKIKKHIGVTDSKWDKCYKNGLLLSLMQEEEADSEVAEERGEDRVKNLFVPPAACQIRTIDGEYFNVDDGRIYIPDNTLLGISAAGGDQFKVLVGNGFKEVSVGPDEYTPVNCPRNFIESISAYGFVENSPYEHKTYAGQDAVVYASPSQVTPICTIPRGGEIYDFYYSVQMMYEDDAGSEAAQLELSEVRFDAESPVCPGIEGYMNDNLIVQFVVPPALGFFDKPSDLPACNKSIDDQSAFILNDVEGPNLRRCSLSHSDAPNRWCGKNRED